MSTPEAQERTLPIAAAAPEASEATDVAVEAEQAVVRDQLSALPTAEVAETAPKLSGEQLQALAALVIYLGSSFTKMHTNAAAVQFKSAISGSRYGSVAAAVQQLSCAKLSYKTPVPVDFWGSEKVPAVVAVLESLGKDSSALKALEGKTQVTSADINAALDALVEALS